MIVDELLYKWVGNIGGNKVTKFLPNLVYSDSRKSTLINLRCRRQPKVDRLRSPSLFQSLNEPEIQG